MSRGLVTQGSMRADSERVDPMPDAAMPGAPPQRRHTRRQRSGVALIVVLWTVVLMASITAMASSAARNSAAVASNLRATTIARSMAESGVAAVTALVDDSLRALAADTVRRQAFLARLEPTDANAPALVQDTLNDGVFAVSVIDVSARLDVNATGADGLAMLFKRAMSEGEARRIALLIEARVRGDDDSRTSARSSRTSSRMGDAAAQARDAQAQRATRDSLGAALLGRPTRPMMRHPFQSLDELLEIPGLDETVLARVAPWLTVDGDGRINRRAASPEVLAAATGSLVDAPTRLLCIARGWQRGHAITREVQAVYEIADDGLRLVRWREQSR